MIRLLLATRNGGKVREIREMTASPIDHAAILPSQSRADHNCAEQSRARQEAVAGIEWVGLDAFPQVADADETGATFAENARLKALHYARATGLHALADDSGLVVDALGGAPGVHSARYAGTPRDDVANNRKLIRVLAGFTPERRAASFQCAMAFASPQRVLIETAGRVHGRIIDEPRGTNGFGYDPHFFIDALGRTAAEMPSTEKHAISHRGEALRAILARLNEWVRTGRPSDD